MTDMQGKIPEHTTETVSYVPVKIHESPSESSETLQSNLPAEIAEPIPLPMANEGEVTDELPHGTLERLVKPDEVAYEVPAEDREIDDGGQPLGIVESCFPYLARRNSNQRHQLSQMPKMLGTCPGMKCYFGTGFDHEEHPHHHQCTKEPASTKHTDEIPLKTVG